MKMKMMAVKHAEENATSLKKKGRPQKTAELSELLINKLLSITSTVFFFFPSSKRNKKYKSCPENFLYLPWACTCAAQRSTEPLNQKRFTQENHAHTNCP